jgi:hypothetical protein
MEDPSVTAICTSRMTQSSVYRLLIPSTGADINRAFSIDTRYSNNMSGTGASSKSQSHSHLVSFLCPSLTSPFFQAKRKVSPNDALCPPSLANSP